MGISLANLIEQLKIDVTQTNGVPTNAQYERCVTNAVRDLNVRFPFRNVTTISIVSGTAGYTLPTDFLRVIKFEYPYYDEASGVIVTGSGLVPMSALGRRITEQHTVIDGTLTLVPTPTYSTTRRLWYQAIHVLDDDQEYPSMDDQWALLMTIKARSLLLSLLAGELSQSGQGLEVYRIGDVQIDKGKGIERLRKTSADLHAEYVKAISDAKGAQGSRASYGWSDLDHLP